MLLSTEQQALVAQLLKKQDQPADCFQLISSNAKTRSFGKFFEDNGLIAIQDETVAFNPAFFVQAHKNGITDEAGVLTDQGEAMSQETIEETYKFLRAMILYAS